MELKQEIMRLNDREREELCAHLVFLRRKARSTTGGGPAVARDHSAFLSSYSPQDEGLYDDTARR